MRPAALAIALTACAAPTTTSGGIVVREDVWRRVEVEVQYKAADDLDCPPTAVQATLVERQGRYPVLVRASCPDGASALYSRQLRRSKGRYTDRNSEWTRN